MKKEIILLNKKYEGFDGSYDYFRDVAEVFDFPEDPTMKKVKGEFNGTLEVVVKFHPADGDIEDG